MFTGCNALLPNEIGPAEALPISPRNPRGANVGYQNKTVSAFKFVGPNFINCNGTEDITLGDLKIICDEESDDPSEGWKPLLDNIILLDEEGNNERTLVYMNEFLATAYSEETFDQGIVWTKGWYDAEDVANLSYEQKYDTEPVPAGEGIQVNVSSGNEDVTIQIDSAL